MVLEFQAYLALNYLKKIKHIKCFDDNLKNLKNKNLKNI